MNKDTRKKRQFVLNLTDEDATRFIEKVCADGATPAEVLEGFINDLTASDYSHGSDERDLAAQYYDRCGYPYQDGKRFIQFLLNDYGLDTVAEALKAKKNAQETIDFVTQYPDGEDGKPDEEGIATMQDIMANCDEEINELYQQYAFEVKDGAETLEDGLKGVRDYLDMIARINKGGAI